MNGMEKKKSASRFCIQFNEQDPHHQQVMDILNAQGRHKAQFIAAAILHYINCSERPAVLQDVTGLRKVIEMIVLEALEKHGGVSAKENFPPTEKRLQGKTRQSSEISTNIEKLDEDTFSAIQDSLAAFRSIRN